MRSCFLILVAFANHAVADEKYTSEKGKYTIVFPAKPTESSRDADSPIGKLAVHIAVCEAKKDLGFIVIYTDYPEAIAKDKPQDVLARVRDGSKGPEGKVLEDREISKGKIPGRDYLLGKGPDQYFRARAFLNGTRLYQIIIAGSKKDEITSPAADKFFDSFEITK